MTRCPDRPLVLLAAVAVVLAGCRGEPEPIDELADAVRATAEASVTFELGLRADPDALETLGDGAGEAARFLEDAGLTGARDPDGAVRLTLSIGAEQPLLEVVSDPDGVLALRTGLGQLLGVSTGDPGEQLDPALTELGWMSGAGGRSPSRSPVGGSS